MRVTIECHGFSTTDAIAGHARHQAREALRFFGHCVQSVDLRLNDVSEAGGPTEYNVVASVSLRDMPRVVVEGNGCDLYLTVRYAAGRAQQAVENAVRRYRQPVNQSRNAKTVVEAMTPVS